MQQASTYSHVSGLQKSHGLTLMAKMGVREGMKALDLGCGTGYLSSVLAERVGSEGRVLGVDPDSKRINIARESYAGNNLKFEVASTDTFPAERDYYDSVFSNFVLHWVEDKQTAFKRIYSSLKPGGIFGFLSVVKHLKFYDELLDLMNAERRAVVYGKLHYESPEYYRSLAGSFKFSTVHEHLISEDVQYESIDEAIDFWFAVTHGMFDPKEADPVELEKFKKRFVTKPFVVSHQHHKFLMILQK